jgi:hypothetical protein
MLAILLLAAGCRTALPSLFTASGPGWRVEQGQALWRPRHGMPELAGELVIATHPDGRCLIQFSKDPLTLMSAQTTATRWLIQFPPRRMSFSGHHDPPSRFAWLFVHAALSGEPLPARFRFERKPDGGWRLENSGSGETIEGFLAP